ncbi:hypothetical protein LINPERPRIM_LOCUS20672 [Linum perenne]
MGRLKNLHSTSRYSREGFERGNSRRTRLNLKLRQWWSACFERIEMKGRSSEATAPSESIIVELRDVGDENQRCDGRKIRLSRTWESRRRRRDPAGDVETDRRRRCVGAHLF